LNACYASFFVDELSGKFKMVELCAAHRPSRLKNRFRKARLLTNI